MFTYTYNAAGRLVRAESLTATLVYTYSADGLRVAQSVNGSVMTTTWDLALPLAQVLATGDGALDVYGLGRIAEQRGGAWAYPLPDALGSVRQWTDSQGTVTYAAGYAPYGETLWQAGNTESAWGFTGEWTDASLGMVYLRARWYDRTAGRFTQRDPLRLERNPYLYANANPIMSTDPAGTCTYRPGDPPNTCRVDPGDWLLKIADQYGLSPRTLILDWNPEYPPPNYTVHSGNLVYLYDRGASNPPTPGPPKPAGEWWYGTSGYLEGWMASVSGSVLGCGAQVVLGMEVVYDFATRPPQRNLFWFTSAAAGAAFSPSVWLKKDFWDSLEVSVQASLSVYAGFAWGFDENQGVVQDYGGPATVGSLELSLGIPVPTAPYVTMGLGVGISSFKSGTSQVQGYTGFVSGGVQVGLAPSSWGVNLATSVVPVNYRPYYGSPKRYGSPEQANLPLFGV